jgi:NADPH-dependent 2,4-dienoyl-CoA reductase/sulfur reductase-like enzyme
MATAEYDYIIVGGGQAGASAADGVRELDDSGSVLIVSGERHLPYERPPLSKQLWLGKKQVNDIFVHDAEFYARAGIELANEEQVMGLNVNERTIVTDTGRTARYGKLLLASGGFPRRLDIPGADLDGVIHFRTLDDYLRLSHDVAGTSVVVVGGGFIGSEIAAALNLSQVSVTMVFPEGYLVKRVFPESLGRAIQAHYEERGILVLGGDVPSAIAREGNRLVVHTRGGERLECDTVVVGAGILPAVSLAREAGLEIGDGIEVDELLETAVEGVFAAGDNALFPYPALGKRTRIEHWDNALAQGRAAGRNMAGAREPFTYVPYFFSDLFDFGYEAVGDVSTALETFADWRDENRTGVIYYLEEGRVRGVMNCNVWDALDRARQIIASGERMTDSDLRGAI